MHTNKFICVFSCIIRINKQICCLPGTLADLLIFLFFPEKKKVKHFMQCAWSIKAYFEIRKLPSICHLPRESLRLNKYSIFPDKQAQENSADPDNKASVASYLGLHCLPLIQQIQDISQGSIMVLFKFWDKYVKDKMSVIQSIISLTSLLMTNSLTVVARVFSNTLIFLLQKCE